MEDKPVIRLCSVRFSAVDKLGGESPYAFRLGPQELSLNYDGYLWGSFS